MILVNSNGNAPLLKVSAAGGIPTAATVALDGEGDHRQPVFLPDGRHFVYVVINRAGTSSAAYLASLDTPERVRLLEVDSSEVFYSRGHLLFLRGTTLMAQRFDANRLELTGEASAIAEQIQMVVGATYSMFSASENGVLAYRTGNGQGGSQLVWVDRKGKQIGVLGDLMAYGDVELSPDGQRAAVNIPDQTGKGRDIWLYDVARGLRTRFTFDPADESSSVWSPDGSRLVFGSGRKGLQDLYQKASSGAGSDELLFEDKLATKFPQSWSADGRFVLYFTGGVVNGTGSDLFVLPLSGDRKPFPFLQTEFSETRGRFSPDGRWVAYSSNESGRNEIYVAPFPGPGGKWQISTTGGSFARWRRDGSEIFYVAPDNKLIVASVNGKEGRFEVGAVKPLFETRLGPAGGYQYDVSPDGQRFLINTVAEGTSKSPITVVTNWTAALKN